MTELTTTMLITEAAHVMVRLEDQARARPARRYWNTPTWRIREAVSEERSRKLRERWAERRVARA